MGTCHSTNPLLYSSFPAYTAAGCLFTDLETVLAATQRHRAIPVLSGLGGKQEAGDADWFDTAWRETAEELFGWTTLPPGLLRSFRTHLQGTPTESVGFVIFQCSFATLHQFLGLCKGYQSPYYKRMPRTLMDLILKRDLTAKGEIGALALLPLRLSPCLVDRFFEGDLKRIVERERPKTVMGFTGPCTPLGFTSPCTPLGFTSPSPPQCVHPPPSDGAPSRGPCSPV